MSNNTQSAPRPPKGQNMTGFVVSALGLLVLVGVGYGSYTESQHEEKYISTNSASRSIYVKVYPSKAQEYAISARGSKDVYIDFGDWSDDTRWVNMTLWSYALAGSFAITVYDDNDNAVGPALQIGDGARRTTDRFDPGRVYRVHVTNNQLFDTRFRLVLDREGANLFNWMLSFYEDNFKGTGKQPAYEEPAKETPAGLTKEGLLRWLVESYDARQFQAGELRDGVHSSVYADFNGDGLNDAATLAWRSSDRKVILVAAVSGPQGYDRYWLEGYQCDNMDELRAGYDEGGDNGIDAADDPSAKDYAEYFEAKSWKEVKDMRGRLAWDWEPYLPSNPSVLRCCFGRPDVDNGTDYFWDGSRSRFVTLWMGQ